MQPISCGGEDSLRDVRQRGGWLRESSLPERLGALVASEYLQQIGSHFAPFVACLNIFDRDFQDLLPANRLQARAACGKVARSTDSCLRRLRTIARRCAREAVPLGTQCPHGLSAGVAPILLDGAVVGTTFCALDPERKRGGPASQPPPVGPGRDPRKAIEIATLLSGSVALLLRQRLDLLDGHRKILLQRERSFHRELDAAREIQMSMLPDSAPSIDGLDIGFVYRPAKKLGGDFFDFLRLGDELGISIGDVAGKSLPAALLVSMQKYVLRSAASPDRSLAVPLQALNRILCDDLDPDVFVCITFARYDPLTRTVHYCNAGQMPPLYASGRRGQCTFFPAREMALGVQQTVVYREQAVRLSPGDILALYTDGVTEAFSPAGEPFGHVRLRCFVRGNRGLSAQELADAILERVLDHAGRQLNDDLTIIILKAERQLRGGSTRLADKHPDRGLVDNCRRSASIGAAPRGPDGRGGGVANVQPMGDGT